MLNFDPYEPHRILAEELIEIIKANSATFDGKTEFSQVHIATNFSEEIPTLISETRMQEKYIKRKKQKYNNEIVVHQTTTENICQLLLVKAPKKTMHMRPDTLAYLMTAANIRKPASAFACCCTLPPP